MELDAVGAWAWVSAPGQKPLYICKYFRVRKKGNTHIPKIFWSQACEIKDAHLVVGQIK